MATVFQMMTGHVVAQIRLERKLVALKLVGRVDWSKAVAVAIHSRRSRFPDDVAYLRLARELEVAARAQLTEEQREEQALAKLKRKHATPGVQASRTLTPAQHREIAPTAMYGLPEGKQKFHVEPARYGAVPPEPELPVLPPRPAITPPLGQRIRSANGSMALLLTPAAARRFARKGWRVTL